ncbi:sigma-70 family RNA polymerase sigma factor [Methylobacillus gramineus]|uniref:sigma-70 family RNA polymerase sigma factor n=1 Tax=Methylobacillus gramineus TaxID=755169 RepID=UPI001CFFA2AD|nr:sigma-70 family RNA polymerase sigma factor [Methylobacillus gramineus]MCB5185753.1 sigma-70 family RNA polymerase sigma factor [Methylobacillus gramineus]
MSIPDHTVSRNAILGDLYQAHHSWLVSLLRRKLSCTNQADDLAHDTFTRILASHSELAGIKEPRAFLTTVAKRLLANHYQRQTLEQAYLQALAIMPEPQAISPEQRLLILQTLHEVDEMLDGLPAKARSAFLLSQLDGLTYDEIAIQLEISSRTVKRYMALAFEQCLLAMV